jgi:hypothetical protein
MTTILIHGAYGHPNENWFPWLKAELKILGEKVFVPEFPTPENQTLENWLMVFDDYKRYLDENTILVGHSLGSAFIFRILERLKRHVKAAFLVAGFTGKLGHHEFDDINKSFLAERFDWEKIKKSCRKFFVYNSDNDPYVPLEQGKRIAENLGVELRLMRGAGHFNADVGYTQFEILLEDIKNVL